MPAEPRTVSSGRRGRASRSACTTRPCTGSWPSGRASICREAFVDGTLTIEEGSLYDLIDLLAAQYRGAARGDAVSAPERLVHPAAPGSSVQSALARPAERGASLRSVGPALRAVSRSGPAIFLRLFPRRRRRSRHRAARQKAAHRGQADDPARAEGARHRFGLGRAGALSRQRVRRRRHRADLIGRAAPGGDAPGCGGRAFRACALSFARLSRGRRAVRPDRLGRHVRACRDQPLRRVFRQGEVAAERPTEWRCCTRSGVWTGRARPSPGSANTSFPAAMSPALSEVTPVVERQRLWITDIEILRLHYARTLRAWRRRFERNRERIARNLRRALLPDVGNVPGRLGDRVSARRPCWSSRCSWPRRSIPCR